jgi:hypothetical protein
MASFSHSLRELTRRISGTADFLETGSARSGTMAEQEEDFSSLPLPDRFQHKVGTCEVESDVKQDEVANLIPCTGLEGTKSGIRRCREAVRSYSRRA